jgi:hypothetical protein
MRVHEPSKSLQFGMMTLRQPRTRGVWRFFRPRVLW